MQKGKGRQKTPETSSANSSESSLPQSLRLLFKRPSLKRSIDTASKNEKTGDISPFTSDKMDKNAKRDTIDKSKVPLLQEKVPSIPSIMITNDEDAEKPSKFQVKSVFVEGGNIDDDGVENFGNITKISDLSHALVQNPPIDHSFQGYISLPNLQEFKKQVASNDENLGKDEFESQVNKTSPLSKVKIDALKNSLLVSRQTNESDSFQKDHRRSSLKQSSLTENTNSFNSTPRVKVRVSFDASCHHSTKSLLVSPSSRLLAHRLSVESSLGYAETLMHGHYTTARLKRMIKEEKDKYDVLRKSGASDSGKSVYREPRLSKFKNSLRHFVTGYTVQNWAFLTCLGICAAFLSFFIDFFVEKCITANRLLYAMAWRSGSVFNMYLAWVLYPLVFILFSASFTKMVGPTAIGSGIPEVKTIMKGVVLKEYLTIKTLVAKVIGLISCLGSGIPLGKVGPFVHVASVTSALLSRLFSIFHHVKENESLQIDILTAASAVGVSCTFAAPIGGVLFSVEATATYFAVKNYWRAFYSAICGALTFRLMSSLFKSEETLNVLFKTNLRQTMAYDVREIVMFIFVGLLCGVLGGCFVWLHKNFVLFIRRQKKLSDFLQKSRLLYPLIITLLIFSLTFPPGLGQYMAGELTLKEAVNQLFDNNTWTLDHSESIREQQTIQIWKGGWNNVLLTITMFFIMKFWMCALAATLPVPCGIFIPSFVLGASLGRLTGELMAMWLPDGIRGKPISPGAYALIGAATFSGAVTHTVSPAVIVFELTGHLAHLIPCVVATMIAGATANFIQPSVYDAMIEIKKLPYLSPTIDSEYCNAHEVTAERIMDKSIPCISSDFTYGEVWKTISSFKYRAYPFVRERGSRVLIGSLLRSELKQMLLKHFSHFESYFTHERKNSIMGAKNDSDEMIQIEDGLLNETADFSSCTIDPAPFQVSAMTSLYKVHWLFSLLSLHHTFVTDGGEIVGCLTLAEVREAIQEHVNDNS